MQELGKIVSRASIQVVNTVGRAIYCAMGTWMNIIEENTLYLEYTDGTRMNR